MKMLLLLALALAAAPAPADDPHAGHGGHEPVAATEAGHGDSLYHLHDAWRDSRGGTLRLGDLAGGPVVIVMMYGSCTSACPILVNDARRLEAALPPAAREATRFVLVSFDPDEPAPLKPAEARWHYVMGDRAQVRALAMMLGVRYRDRGDGHFDHSNLITVLDADGRIVHRTEGLMQPVEPAAAAITTALE